MSEYFVLPVLIVFIPLPFHVILRQFWKMSQQSQLEHKWHASDVWFQSPALEISDDGRECMHLWDIWSVEKMDGLSKA